MQYILGVCLQLCNQVLLELLLYSMLCFSAASLSHVCIFLLCYMSLLVCVCLYYKILGTLVNYPVVIRGEGPAELNAGLSTCTGVEQSGAYMVTDQLLFVQHNQSLKVTSADKAEGRHDRLPIHVIGSIASSVWQLP